MTDSLVYTPDWGYSDVELLISNVYSEQGYFGDGTTYGREMGRISPEGNIYGQTRTVREIISYWWWDGSDYQYFQVSGEAELVSSLPSGPRPFGEIWRVRSTTSLSTDQRFYYDYYVWDSSSDQWVQVEWYFDVEKKNELPYPGYGIGAAHRVREQDVYVIWDGYTWKRFPAHSSIADDEPERHLPPGFINLIVSDAELVFVSPKEIAARQTVGGTGEVWVGSEKLSVSEACSLFNHLPVLEISGDTVTPIYPEPLTEYRIYLANNQSTAFSVAALPGDSTHNETPEWDFRGKLFLVEAYDESGNEINEPTGNLLSDYGVGSNALFVGRIETDATPKSSGGPRFRRVLDLSYLSKSPSIRGLFYDVCDFYLSYIDQDTIRFAKFDGFRGQMYIPSQLVHIGEGYNLTTSSPYVSVDSITELPDALNTGPLGPDTHYYIYIGNRIDELNFNVENERTGRPWQREDVGSEGNYDSDLDLRLKPFFSTRRPEDFPYNNEPVGVYRMTDTYPLFYTRLLGHIYTDSNGKFLYAKDISYIRSLTVNPTHLKGLADFAVKAAGSTVFRINAKPATSGVIYVGGHTLRAQDVSDLSTTALVRQFNSSAPYLTNLSAANTYTDTTIYVYLANFDAAWGNDAGDLFFCLTQPTDGYLSTDWPGSGARWIATVKTDENGEFTGYWLIDSCGDTTEILLTQFEITDLLQSQTSELISHASQIDFLFGWGSDIDLGMDSYISAIWSGWSDLSGVTDDIWSNYSDISSVADSLGSVTDSLWDVLSDVDSDLSLLDSGISNLDYITSAFGSELSLFRSDLDSLDGHIDSLDSVVSSLGEDITDLREFQGSFDELTWSFLNDASNLFSLTESLKSDVSDMASDISEMSELSSELNEIESRLESDYSYISGIYSLMSQNTDYIIEDHKNLMDLHFWLEINESNLRDDYENLSAIQDSMTGNLVEIFSDTSALSDIASGLSDVTSLIDLWVDGLESLHFNLEENVESLGYYLSDLSQELVYLDSNLSDLDEQTDLEFSDVWSNMGVISEDVSYLFSYYSNISDYTDELGESLSQLDSYTDSLSNLLVSLDSNLVELDSDLLVQSGLIDDMESAVDLLGSHLDIQSGYISALSDTADDLDSHISDQSQYAQSLSQGINNLDSDLGLLDSELSSLYSVTSDLGSKYSTTSNLVNSVSNTVSSVSATANAYYGLTNSLSSILDDLESDYVLTSGLVGSLSADYSNLDNRFDEISGFYDDYSLQIGWLESTMSEVSEGFSDVSALVSDIEELTDSLSEDASELSGNLVSMSGYLNGLSGDISGLDSYISQLESNLNGNNAGYVGTVPQLITYDWIGKRFVFEDQKSAGLPTQLTYYQGRRIKLHGTNTASQVVTPNGGLYDIRSTDCHIMVPDGLSASTLYYIYLTMPNSIAAASRYLNTDYGAPSEATVVAGGSGYYYGEVLTAVSGGASDGTMVVTRTNAGIVAYGTSFGSAGVDYTVGDILTLSQGGASGGQIQVTGIQTGVKTATVYSCSGGFSVGNTVTVSGGNGAATLYVSEVGQGIQSYAAYCYNGQAVPNGTAFTITGGGGNCTGVTRDLQQDWEGTWTFYLTIVNPGTGYTTGSYVVSIPGYSNFYISTYLGTTFATGVVSALTVTAYGDDYSIANNVATSDGRLRVNITALTSGVETFAIYAAGSGFIPQIGVPLTGGTGSGATVNITALPAAAVTTVYCYGAGSGYPRNTTLNTTGGSGNGCQIRIDTVAIPSNMVRFSTTAPTGSYGSPTPILKIWNSDGTSLYDSVLVGYCCVDSSNNIASGFSLDSVYSPTLTQDRVFSVSSGDAESQLLRNVVSITGSSYTLIAYSGTLSAYAYFSSAYGAHYCYASPSFSSPYSFTIKPCACVGTGYWPSCGGCSCYGGAWEVNCTASFSTSMYISVPGGYAKTITMGNSTSVSGCTAQGVSSWSGTLTIRKTNPNSRLFI